MSDDLFNVAVPDADLEAPAFTLIPTGEYLTILQSGTKLVDNAERGGKWKGIRLPFQNFRDTKNGTREFARTVNAQFTYENPDSDKAVEIGNRSIIEAAAAFGLTEPTTTSDGKPAQKLTAGSMAELVDQFNQMAGTEVAVYMTGGPQIKGGKPVMKQDGSGPMLSNEIKRISAVKNGNGHIA